MVLLNDGFRSLAHNFGVFIGALVTIFMIVGAFHFATAYVLSTQIALTSSHPVEPPQHAEVVSNTAEIGTAGNTLTPPTLNAQEDGPDEADFPPSIRAICFALEILFALSLSAAYTFIFVLLGRSIDRPVWKCDVPWEAMRRYYSLWFLLMFISLAAQDIGSMLPTADAQIAMLIIIQIWGCICIPLGCCIMFHGSLNWKDLGERLAVIPRQFHLFAIVLPICLLELVLQDGIEESLPRGIDGLWIQVTHRSLLSLPITALDLLIFCICWRICILDRDAAHHAPRDFDD